MKIKAMLITIALTLAVVVSCVCVSEPEEPQAVIVNPIAQASNAANILFFIKIPLFSFARSILRNSAWSTIFSPV